MRVITDLPRPVRRLDHGTRAGNRRFGDSKDFGRLRVRELLACNEYCRVA